MTLLIEAFTARRLESPQTALTPFDTWAGNPEMRRATRAHAQCEGLDKNLTKHPVAEIEKHLIG